MSRAVVFATLALVAGCTYPVDDFVIVSDASDATTSPDGTNDTATTSDALHDGAGSDTSSCAAPRTTCGVDCADLATDEKHCGSCDQVCNSGSKCRSGKCKAAGG